MEFNLFKQFTKFCTNWYMYENLYIPKISTSLVFSLYFFPKIHFLLSPVYSMSNVHRSDNLFSNNDVSCIIKQDVSSY